MDGANAIDYIITNNIEGDLVECGIDSARQQVIWINSLRKHNKTRNILYLLIINEGDII